ncbi:hypothetical protein HDV00_004856 [Rhizophlyctis rosea]|nr:hypothetical protein HDV00_004856 [Rhizophlyctis rosea]
MERREGGFTPGGGMMERGERGGAGVGRSVCRLGGFDVPFPGASSVSRRRMAGAPPPTTTAAWFGEGVDGGAGFRRARSVAEVRGADFGGGGVGPQGVGQGAGREVFYRRSLESLVGRGGGGGAGAYGFGGAAGVGGGVQRGGTPEGAFGSGTYLGQQRGGTPRGTTPPGGGRVEGVYAGGVGGRRGYLEGQRGGTPPGGGVRGGTPDGALGGGYGGGEGVFGRGVGEGWGRFG